MDANSGEPWSEADISDLKNELDHGRTIAETASFLCRDVGRGPREDEGARVGQHRASDASSQNSPHTAITSAMKSRRRTRRHRAVQGVIRPPRLWGTADISQ